ncbi:MAG: hypothetical protein K2N50_05875, partial [Clostridia bacterium]|nr:hypothetical protein [Clostridia bacterium]
MSLKSIKRHTPICSGFFVTAFFILFLRLVFIWLLLLWLRLNFLQLFLNAEGLRPYPIFFEQFLQPLRCSTGRTARAAKIGEVSHDFTRARLPSLRFRIAQHHGYLLLGGARSRAR